MPPPTQDKSNSVGVSLSDLSGPENTTGQDFIFTPRNTSGSTESNASDPDEIDAPARPRGRVGSKADEKTKRPNKKETREKAAPPKCTVSLPPALPAAKEPASNDNAPASEEPREQFKKGDITNTAKGAANTMGAEAFLIAEQENGTRRGSKKGKCCAIL